MLSIEHIIIFICYILHVQITDNGSYTYSDRFVSIVLYNTDTETSCDQDARNLYNIWVKNIYAERICFNLYLCVKTSHNKKTV